MTAPSKAKPGSRRASLVEADVCPRSVENARHCTLVVGGQNQTLRKPGAARRAGCEPGLNARPMRVAHPSPTSL
jgi:hypothetical protein